MTGIKDGLRSLVRGIVAVYMTLFSLVITALVLAFTLLLVTSPFWFVLLLVWLLA